MAVRGVGVACAVVLTVAGAEYTKECVCCRVVNADFTWPGNTLSNLAVMHGD